jgi:hypothetical protein
VRLSGSPRSSSFIATFLSPASAILNEGTTHPAGHDGNAAKFLLPGKKSTVRGNSVVSG